MGNGKELTDKALQALAADLEAGHSQALTNYLKTAAKFRQYSFNNQMLIAFQRPEATFVAGFHSWKNQFKRFVKKGEKGIMILAPMIGKKTSKDEATGEETTGPGVYGFRGVYVWDVAQTDGEPMPEFATVHGDPGEMLPRLREIVSEKGATLSYADNLRGARGLSHANHSIEILNGLPPAEEFSVLTHELAHELLHKGDRRAETTKTVRELEAEAVSFVVAQAVGLETGSAAADYIQLYSGDAEKLSKSLEYIRNTASEIIDALGEEAPLVAQAA